jgi:flagellar biosynthesis component FlhA
MCVLTAILVLVLVVVIVVMVSPPSLLAVGFAVKVAVLVVLFVAAVVRAGLTKGVRFLEDAAA